MRKTAVSLLAGIIVVLMIMVLNALCAGCVYARQSDAPVSRGHAISFSESRIGGFAWVARPASGTCAATGTSAPAG